MKIAASGDLHGRAIEEWIGKTPDTPAPPRVQLRILLRQGRKCAITGVLLGGKNKPHCDHIIRLEAGGENRESNLQMIWIDSHKAKTAVEDRISARVKSLQKKHHGIGQTIKQRRAFQSKYKKKVNGEVVLR